MVVGVGDVGVFIVKEICSVVFDLEFVGFVDDNLGLVGVMVFGVWVFGMMGVIVEFCVEYCIDEVIFVFS